MDAGTIVLYIVILIMSVVIHELAHGYMADYLGDPTARLAGRLTMNPIKHLDMWGSVIVPLFLVVARVPFVIGWAKPVPFNPYNLRAKKWGMSLVAIAGPLSNLVIAIIFGLALRIMGIFGAVSGGIEFVFSGIVIINLVLMVFNLIPVPPLDGHYLLFDALSSPRYAKIREFLRRYSIIIFLFVIFFLWSYIFPLVLFLYNVIVGIPFVF